MNHPKRKSRKKLMAENAALKMVIMVMEKTHEIQLMMIRHEFNMRIAGVKGKALFQEGGVIVNVNTKDVE